MNNPAKYRLTDLQLLLLAAGRFVIHLLTNNQYGFHRDALAFLGNGQHLAWGYVAYPPLTPFIGRIGLELFGVSLLIFLPNLIWQVQHEYVSLEFLQAIRARDVAIGRSEGYLSQQFYVNLNPLTLPFFLLGLHYYFFSPDGSRYRVVGWIYLITLALFGFSQGRFYYMAPAYPMLLAGGAV